MREHTSDSEYCALLHKAKYQMFIFQVSSYYTFPSMECLIYYLILDTDLFYFYSPINVSNGPRGMKVVSVVP